MAENLTITIGGDSSKYTAELNKISDETKNFENQLKSLSLISGAAFAALTGSALLALKAFEDNDKAVRQLTVSLRSQGIFTEELSRKYQDIASSLQELTGIEDEVIIRNQALLQSFLGSTEQTEEFNLAILDLAEGLRIDVDTAFQLVGKSVGTHTNALARYGIQLDENATKEEKIAQLMQISSSRYEGAAAAANQGLGAIRGLQSAFSELLEEIGGRIAPVFAELIKSITKIFTELKKNEPLLDLITGLGVAAAAITGIVTVIGVGVLAFIKLRAALFAVNTALGLTSLSIKGLIGATGIGLLIILAADLVLNWKTRFAQLQAIFRAFAENISSILSGLGKLFIGVFKLDLSSIKAGFQELKTALASFGDDYDSTLKAIENKEKESQEKRSDQRREFVTAEQAERRAALEQLLLENEEFQALDDEQKAIFREQNKQQLEEAVQSRSTILRNSALREVQEDAKRRAQFIEDEKKFGTTIATLNQALGSRRVQAASELSGQLISMQQSENSTLKSIGKAAAIAKITIDTAQGAVAAYTRSIEIFGPILGNIIGVALAGAVVAFGAENIGKVNAAQAGGIVEGGVRGVDSVPFMLEPGELVVPRKNFGEVVNAVAAQRSRAENAIESETATGAGQSIAVMIGFDGDESQRVLTAKQTEARALGTFRGNS